MKPNLSDEDIIKMAIDLANINKSVEIVSGINEGDNVIITGQSKLLDGSKVKVIK